MKINNLRWCTRCEEVMIFRYNPVLKHSECKECGARFAIKKRGEIIRRIDKKANGMIEKAEKWRKAQKNRVLGLGKGKLGQ